MSHSSLPCPRCGRPTIDGNCRRCAGHEDVVMEETRQKLERSREQLSAWRERLRVKLEEADRKRTLLAKPDARRAAHAPTVRLADERTPGDIGEQAVADDPLGTVERFSPSPVSRPPAPAVESTSPIAVPEAHPIDEPLSMAAPEPVMRVSPLDRELQRTASLHLITESTPRVRDNPTARGRLMVEEPAPGPPPPSRGGPNMVIEAATEETTDGALPFLSGSLVEAPHQHISSESRVTLAPEPSIATTGVNEYRAPSLLMHAAANLLDVLLLLVLPAATLSLPVSWLAIQQGKGSLWASSPVLTGGIFIAVFILLQTAFVGSVGRTPGLRLAGLQVVDAQGRIPSFLHALVRALLLPVLLIPPLERIVGTSTVAE